MSDFVLKGNICFSVDKENIETVDGYLACVDGKCAGVFKNLPSAYKDLDLIDYGDNLIIPGMVDLHIHAPQYAFRGLGYDYELLDWLDNIAFKEENKYADVDYAKKAYKIFVDEIKKSATTRLSIFASRHVEATIELMKQLEKNGLVSYVGKVNMDRDAPKPLVEENSLQDTIDWLEKTDSKFKNTKPIITPRFIPSCSDELLYNLGRLLLMYDVPVQSHLSENLGEIEYVKKLCPDSKFYGDAYDKYGLFGKVNDYLFNKTKRYKTLMAHCVYSSDAEIKLMKENDVYIVHCPSSNMNVSSGMAPIRKYLDLDMNMGLGSDVAGGTSESMFSIITKTIEVSKMYWRCIDQKYKALNFNEAFYLATMGGGKFFGDVGTFKEGYEMDAIVLDDSILKTTLKLSPLERLHRAIYLSLDLKGGIKHKYVKGRKLF